MKVYKIFPSLYCECHVFLVNKYVEFDFLAGFCFISSAQKLGLIIIFMIDSSCLIVL